MGPMSDPARAQDALDHASALIRVEADLTWVDDDGEFEADRPDILKFVCLSAAQRALTNPDGLQSQSVIGYSETRAHASPDVYLTKGERRDVRRAAGKSSVGTLATSRGDLETAAVSCVPYWDGDTDDE